MIFGRLQAFFSALFLKRGRGNSAWESSGRLKYLSGREPEACAVSGVSAEVVERTLVLFCDAFDIPQEQRFCLCPADQLHDIYRAMVTGRCDEMEYERLMINVEDAIGRALKEQELESVVTIEHLIRFVHEQLSLNLKRGIK
ncbi:MAG: hypothetical protein V4710_20220 [Verrucomicrobiota bacterium]